MASMSDYLEVELRKHIFRTGSFTKPTVLAVALCTAAPSDSSTGSTITEPNSGHGYARQTLNPGDGNWSAPNSTGGVTANQAALTFGPVTTSDWPQITHVAICDSATYGAGNLLFHGALSVAKTAQVGDTVTFDIDALTITFA
jgi:hypothetical protein